MHLGAKGIRRKDFSYSYRIVRPEKSHAWSQETQSLMAKGGMNRVHPDPPGPLCPPRRTTTTKASQRGRFWKQRLPVTRVPSHLAGLVVVSGMCMYLAMPVLSSWERPRKRICNLFFFKHIWLQNLCRAPRRCDFQKHPCYISSSTKKRACLCVHAHVLLGPPYREASSWGGK